MREKEAVLAAEQNPLQAVPRVQSRFSMVRVTGCLSEGSEPPGLHLYHGYQQLINLSSLSIKWSYFTFMVPHKCRAIDALHGCFLVPVFAARMDASRPGC